MTREEAYALVTDVLAAHHGMSEQFHLLDACVGSTVESPLSDACWKTMDVLIECVSALIGDEREWLSWYIWENDCGNKGLEASRPDGTMAPVSTVADLLAVVGCA